MGTVGFINKEQYPFFMTDPGNFFRIGSKAKIIWGRKKDGLDIRLLVMMSRGA